MHFKAPWDSKAAVITGAFVVLCVVAYVFSPGAGSYVFVAILLIGLVFAVRGYSVLNEELLIHRLGWSTRFPLAELDSVELSPGSTLGSIRTFGIGGLFGYVGHFRNSMLGSYRAYATDTARTVVLRFGKKTIVVSPDRPADFVRQVRETAQNFQER